jgi:fibronectin-binding autotransporter adhesin
MITETKSHKAAGTKSYKLSLAVASGVAALLVASSARAATYTWDNSGAATSGNLVTDGSGTWSTSNNNWWNSTTGTDQAWTNNTPGDTAVFGATPGAFPYTVTLGQPTTASGIVFQSQNYTIAGGGNLLTMNSASTTFATPDFIVAPGVAATISSNILKSSGSTYLNGGGTTAAFANGGGTLTLSGSDSFASNLWVDNATLQVPSGTIIAIKSGDLVLGNSYSNSNYVQTGGSVNCPTTYVGNEPIGASSSFTLSGGTYTNTAGFNLAERANGTMTVSGGSLFVGSTFTTAAGAADSATINISAGTCTLNSTNEFGALAGASSTTINVSAPAIFNLTTSTYLGYTSSASAVLNVASGTVNVAGGNFGLSYANAAAAGVINQSGGQFNANGTTAMFIAWDLGQGTPSILGNLTGYGAYNLSAGTLNFGASTTMYVGWEGHCMGLFSQTGGTANIAGNLYTAGDANYGGQGVVDVSAGRLTHTGGNFMDTGESGGATTAVGIVTVRGSGYLQEQTGNFIVTNKAAATGIVNVVSGGTLDVSRIYTNSTAASFYTSLGTSTINFDGGTLRAYNTNANGLLYNLTNAFIYPGGLTFDTNSQNVTIAQQLSAPQGYGVLTTGSTLSIPNGDAGSGYISPPVVAFSSTSGVPATGVAVLSGGSVAGIIITSPGSGYTSGQSVTVTFNGNNTVLTGVATSLASSFSVNPAIQNTGGGLTVIGGGGLTLTASNGYSGTTNVSSGSLYINGVDNSSSISVSGGAALGGTGSTTAPVNVASTGILDFSKNAGNSFSVPTSLTFAGSATINVGSLSGNYSASPALSVGSLLPSAAAHLVAINANVGSLSVSSGTYDLINYNSIGGAGTSAFTLSSVNGISNRQSASLVNVGNQIDVVVTGNTPYWNGNQSDWVSTNAFTLQPSGGTATFQTGDNDIFDDSASSGTGGVGNVLLNTGNVAPSAVTFNNTNLAYTLSGNFGITGSASLALTGSGSVTIANSNGYTGMTTIGSYGTLQIGVGGASGSLSPSPSAAIVDNGALVFSRSDNIIQGTHFSSAGITGGGSLTQLGPGMVTLTASNTYSGPTTISGGTLQLGTGAANQDGSISGAGGVTNNGTLAYNLAGSQTASYSIGGSGFLEKAGTGTLVLSATNSYMNGTTVNAGTLQLNAASYGITGGDGGTLPVGGLVTVNSGATLWANKTDTLGYYTGSTGTISLIGGTMTITAGIHTNVGYLGMTAGTLTSLGAGDATSNYIFNAGVTTFASSAPSVINANTIELRDSVDSSSVGLVEFNVARGSGPVDLIVSSNLLPIGGSGLDMVGPGIMLFTGSGSYVGNTEIDSGTLQIGAGGTSGALSPSSQIVNEGTLAFSRSDNIVQGLQFSSSISGVGGLTQLGPGTLTLNAMNTYTGPTVISGGVLNVTNLANQFNPSAIGEGTGSATDLAIDSGTLQYSGAAPQSSNWLFTVGPTGAATVNASGGPGGTLTLGSQGGSIGFANGSAPATLTLTGSGAGVLGASIGDSGTSPNVTSLVKTGTGTWTLGGANTYSGTTTISAGTLNIAGVNAGTGPLKVNGGALYITGSAAATSISVAGAATLGGTGAAASAAASVANGGILDLSQNAGNAFSLGSLTFLGHATIDVDALANYANNPVLSIGALATSSTAGLVAIDANLGSATVTSGTYDLISHTGPIGGAGLAGFTITVNGISNRQTAFVVNASNQIDVVVTGATPYWNGNKSDWTSAGAFTLQPGGGTATFQTGDTDIFDDSATGSTFGGNVALNIGNVAPSVVEFNNTNLAYMLSGAFGITGTGSLSVAGSGLVTIANSNGYTGGTTIGSYGTLQIGAGGAIGSLSPSSSIADNGMLAFSRSDNIVQGTHFSSTISGGGGLTQLGPGTVTLTATNTYSGPTTISGGTLQLGTGAAGHDGSIGGTSGVTDNGMLAYDVAGSQAASYSIGGSGNLSMIGSGTLVLAGSNGYSGATTVSKGVLQTGNSAAFGASSSLSISAAATVDLAGNSPVAGALSGAPGSSITNNGNAPAIFATNSSGSSTFAGTISDGISQTSLTASGSGELVLTGNNTYSGTTAVTGGTLTVPAGGAINSASNIFVGGPNGAMLNVSGGLVASSYNVGFQSVFALTIGYNGSPGAVNISGGTVNLYGATTGIVMGGNTASGAPATFTQTGGLLNVGSETIYMANEPGGVSQMALSGGTFNSNGGSVVVGERDNATLTVSGNAVVNFNNNVYIDNSAGNAYTLNCALNMQGGTVTQIGNNLFVGNGLGTGTYNQTGGGYICESAIGVYIGNGTGGGTGVMSVSGGTFVETAGTMFVGQNAASSGSLSVGGGASLAGVYAPGIVLANNGATGAASLLGNGALVVGTGGISQGSGAGTFNFDGGTLAANGSTVNFMEGLTAAIVEEDGGVIDNRGFAITIAQNLQSGGLNPVDGGLLFQGAGTTTLSGTNTYNGGTTVIGGMVIATNNEAIGDGTNLSVGSDLSAFGALIPADAGHAAAAPGVSAVPEPGTLAITIALLGGAALFRRLRRR